jgi:hypothetical protein
MTQPDVGQIKSALIDISQYSPKLGEIDGELLSKVAKCLSGDLGFCVCYGVNKVLAGVGLDVFANREQGYTLLESIFRSALALIDVSKFSVTPRPMTLASMDVDGFNLNQSFSHDGQVAARAFMTAKCLHFDAATPFIANIYGPNENISGGYPLICDVRRFCQDRRLSAARLVENIPNNYNVAIKSNVYDELLDEYSFALKANLDSDILIVMLLNEIQFGLAHGATDSQKCTAEAPSRRPIRHLEYQYGEESHYEEWYRHYGLDILVAKDYAGENLSLHYHAPARKSFENLVELAN